MYKSIPAAFYRGGTSKAIIFKDSDLPKDKNIRDKIFLDVLGSPDHYGDQLNGLGGGKPSLSKIMVVAPSNRQDADIEYTLGKVSINKPYVDYSCMCNNMISATGAFAVNQNIIKVPDGEVVIRVYNTNMKRLFRVYFLVKNGQAIEAGDLKIPGVTQTGAMVRLETLNPGGAITGKLLPTSNVIDTLYIKRLGNIQVSIVDAVTPTVYVKAKDLAKTGLEIPQLLDSDSTFMDQMEDIRKSAGVIMGLASRKKKRSLRNPKSCNRQCTK